MFGYFVVDNMVYMGIVSNSNKVKYGGGQHGVHGHSQKVVLKYLLLLLLLHLIILYQIIIYL